MRIGSRERIVIGVIGAVGAIAGIHFAFFHRTAREYRDASAKYEQIKATLAAQGSAKPWADIHKFEYQTVNNEMVFYGMLGKSGIAIPMPFTKVFSSPEEEQRGKAQQFDESWKLLAELEKMRDSGKGTKLTFLEKYWQLLRQLPPTVSRGGSEVSDLVRKLQDTNALIESARTSTGGATPTPTPVGARPNTTTGRGNEGSQLLLRKEQEYEAQLNAFGLNLKGRERAKEILGKVPAMLYTLNRIDLVRKAVPSKELGIKTDEEYVDRLKKLFRFETWDVIPFNMYKQLVGLRDLCTLASQYGIQEISEVKMWDARDIRWPPLEERQKSATAAAPAMMGAGIMEEGMIMDESMMEGMDPSMMEGRGGGLDAAAAAAAAEEDKKNIIGQSVPIEMRFTGTNTAVMQFLYAVANDPRHWAIDTIDIQAQPKEETLLDVRVVISVMSYYIAFPMSEDDMKAKLDTLVKDKNRLALKEGVKDLAAQEGYTPDPNNVSPDPTYAPAAPQAEAGL